MTIQTFARSTLFCLLAAAPLAAQFPTGTFSVEFNYGTTGTLEMSGPADGNYTVELTVGDVATTQTMRMKDGHLVGADPLTLIQDSSTEGCVKLGLATSTGLTGSASQ